jgi:site-specific DNA-methyltransferase (cytosine-N4-specific)
MSNPRNLILTGDCRSVLRTLPSNYVQCVVTSPPYLGLRDYGHEGQIGLESTLEEFLAALVDVFSEVKRVLRGDGTLWLNLGDAYVTKREPPFKPKDLRGIPWRSALALQEDGWYLRSSIIWEKTNAMPESVRDRPTVNYEYVFLLTKSTRYFYDGWPLREDTSQENPSGRQGRAVWSFPTAPSKAGHDAVMAPQLALRCLRAGTSEQGSCLQCGAPWERVLSSAGQVPQTDRRRRLAEASSGEASARLSQRGGTARSTLGAGRGGDVPSRVVQHTGWAPSCNCHAERRPCLVLDPFAGSGTTLLAAADLGLDYLGIELNPEYVQNLEPLLKEADDRKVARMMAAYALGEK